LLYTSWIQKNKGRQIYDGVIFTLPFIEIGLLVRKLSVEFTHTHAHTDVWV